MDFAGLFPIFQVVRFGMPEEYETKFSNAGTWIFGLNAGSTTCLCSGDRRLIAKSTLHRFSPSPDSKTPQSVPPFRSVPRLRLSLPTCHAVRSHRIASSHRLARGFARQWEHIQAPVLSRSLGHQIDTLQAGQ
jgi:hypothetical protein